MKENLYEGWGRSKREPYCAKKVRRFGFGRVFLQKATTPVTMKTTMLTPDLYSCALRPGSSLMGESKSRDTLTWKIRTLRISKGEIGKHNFLL